MARTLVNTINKPIANYLINGNFFYWQRRLTFTGTPAGGAYNGPDRWRISGSGSGTATIARTTFTVGQTDVPGNPVYYFKWNQTVAASTQMSIDQRVENVVMLGGKTVVVSFWARSNSGGTGISFNSSQNFGTGGSPSAPVSIVTTPLTLTTLWQRFTMVVNIPSIAGKTLGNDGTNSDFTSFSINMPATGLWNIDIAQFMVSESDSEFKLYASDQYGELRACQRYYEKSYNVDVPPGTVTDQGALVAQRVQNTITDTFPIRYVVTKRLASIITIAYSNATGASHNIRDLSGGADRAATYSLSGATGFAVSAAVQAGSPHAWHFTAEAEL